VNWPDFSIRHKYTVFAMVLAIVIFGIYAKGNIKQELFPETAPPLVNVITAYPGTSPADVDKNLSQILEEEFVTIPGAKTIKSSSQDGLSIVKVEFEYSKDVDEAAVDVQNAIARIRKNLPQGIAEPQVMKFSSANRPVLTLGLSGKDMDLAKVRDLADNEIKDRLQLTEGVAAVDVIGGNKRQVNVLLDRSRLSALNVPLEKVAGAIKNTNITDPGGKLIHSTGEYTVRFTQEKTGTAALNDLIVDNRGGKPVYLRDVATIEDGTVENRSAYRFSGDQSIGIQVFKKDDANTVEVVDRVKAKLKEIKRDYPGITFAVAEDDSIFTKQVVGNMAETTRDALILTALIVLLFLVALNESVIVALSMPLSLLCTLGLMKVAGMSLNLHVGHNLECGHCGGRRHSGGGKHNEAPPRTAQRHQKRRHRRNQRNYAGQCCRHVHHCHRDDPPSFYRRVCRTGIRSHGLDPDLCHILVATGFPNHHSPLDLPPGRQKVGAGRKDFKTDHFPLYPWGG